MNTLHSSTRPSALWQLSDEVGILAEYVDQTGDEVRRTSDDTRRAVLRAMGFEAATDEAAASSLAALRDEGRQALLAPARVVVVGAPAARVLPVQAPFGRAQSGPWRLEVRTEDESIYVTEGPWRGESSLELDLPALPLGYHHVSLEMSAGGREWRNEQTLIVVPTRCVTPDEVLGGRPAFGLVANLYTLRSATDWGVGDFSDLSALAKWGGGIGADFVGVNPLHALLDRGPDISPYSPVSRLFRNPIYIDVARVPDLADAADVQARLASPEFATELEALRQSPAVQYEQVMAVKGLALGALYRSFNARVRGSDSARDRAYTEYVRANDPALTRFALWMAIVDAQRTSDWRRWPSELRDAGSEAVRLFADEHASRVDYHRWLQFETDRQLGVTAHSARAAGMGIGLYHDLAIGTSAASADTWMFPELFASGVSVGAPPDPYAATGQNWGLPPLEPRALRRASYRYFIDLLRAGFRHGGALRIDHVLGLFRLFWIPEWGTAADGAYVRYPSHDLLGIVALESVRHGAIVVGEDLGTVPPEVPPALAKWGILSSKVLRFECDRNGYRPPASYPRLALAMADTHDMTPIAGFWEERDIDIRQRVGAIDENEAACARTERSDDRAALLRLLADERILPDDHAPHSPAELRGAVHELVCRTPSVLVGIALDDLAGERDPVNVPGVGLDRFPCWSRKMRQPIETIFASSETYTALRCDGRRRAGIDDPLNCEE